jgi:hypothetical protein
VYTGSVKDMAAASPHRFLRSIVVAQANGAGRLGIRNLNRFKDRGTLFRRSRLTWRTPEIHSVLRHPILLKHIKGIVK